MRRILRDNGLLLVNLGLFVIFLVAMSLAGVRGTTPTSGSTGSRRVVLEVPGDRRTSSRRSSRTGRASSCRWASTSCSRPSCSRRDRPSRRSSTRRMPPTPIRAKQTCASATLRGRCAGRTRAQALRELARARLRPAVLRCRLRLHAVGGASDYNEEQLAHGGEAVSTLASTSPPRRFWFESFQNWQSEFLAVACIVVPRSSCDSAVRPSRNRSPSRTRPPGPEGHQRGSLRTSSSTRSAAIGRPIR